MDRDNEKENTGERSQSDSSTSENENNPHETRHGLQEVNPNSHYVSVSKYPAKEDSNESCNDSIVVSENKQTPDGEPSDLGINDTLITQLMDMGFTYDKVAKALETTGFNDQAAVEILLIDLAEENLKESSAGLEGFEDIVLPPPEPCHADSGAAASERMQVNVSAAEEQEEIDDDDMEISGVSEAMESDSNLVEEPDDRDELYEDEDENDAGDEARGEEESRSCPPSLMNMTVEERKAVNTLVAMGFQEDLVVQVYFAFNKDENLAANFLLQNNGAL